MIHNRLSRDVQTPAARSKRRVTMGMVGVILAAGAATAGTGTALATSASPVGRLDGLVVSADHSTWTLSGWAIDYKTPTSPIDVHIYLDGSYVTATTADGARTDLSAATVSVAGADHGFGVTITAPTTVGTHYACAYAIDSGGVGPNPLIGRNG